MKQFLKLIFILANLSMFVACDFSTPTDSKDPTPKEMTFEYDLQPNAVIIDSSKMIAFKSQSEDKFVFDKAKLTEAGLSLEVSQVLLLEDTALVKILSIEEQASDIVVNTQAAALNELFENADISWSQGLNISAQNAPTLEIAGQSVEPTVLNPLSNAIAYKTTVNGFEISLELEPDVTNASFKLKVAVETKPGGGGSGFKVEGVGKVGVNQQSLSTQIRNGESTNWDFNLDDIDYEFEVAYGGAEAGIAEFQLALPEAFELAIPIVTPVPLGLELRFGFALLAKVELPASASTRVSISYGYSGDAGFKTQTGSVAANGQTSSQSLTINTAEAAALSGPVGATFAASVPRITLKSRLVKDTSLKLDNIYSVSSLFTGSALPGVCLGAGTQHSVKGSYELSFWGFSYKGEHTFYEKYDEKKRGNQKGCEEGSQLQTLASNSLRANVTQLAQEIAVQP